MTTMTLPAYNFCMLAVYADMVPVCKKFQNGSKIAEISMLIPGERGSYQVFVTGSLAEEAARSIKPEDFIMCYGRGTSTKSGNKFCLQAIRVVNYGKDIDAEYLEPLQIINAYTMEIPEAGFHRTEL